MAARRRASREDLQARARARSSGSPSNSSRLISVNPIKLLVLVAVINGVTAGPFLIVVMRVSSDRAIMGESINGALARGLGWATTGLMLIAAVALFATGGA